MGQNKLLVPLLVAVVLGSVVGCAAEATGTSSSGGAPARHMINNSGHELAFYVSPGKLPAIVLDSGGGLDASYWNKVVGPLARDTGSEIITYDRAGLGASAEVPGPWNVANAVSDLAVGLTQLGVTHDVVLVSHSEAGEIATYFVRDHPGVVSGAVLVDASLPEFYTDDEIARVEAAEAPQIAALRQAPSTKANRQLLAVAADYVPMHKAYHQLSWPANVPVIVIASARTPFPDSPQDARLWRDAQAKFAQGATNRQLVVAEGSSHDVPIDRPDVVLDAAQGMVTTVRPTGL
ncbi:MAG TPA: alpha/beta hydrolase [Pseudonocardiaceae bacterium]|nr:alpha/beta hydrolase [Pseudonocardiaceae bacterium]